MQILVASLALAAGFVFLARGADALVDGGATLARRFGISAWAVGLTVVAWGTSVPEVVVSAVASYEERPGYALGNVIGSNIANVGLVLGITGLLLPRVVSGRLGFVDAGMFIGSLGALWYALSDRLVTRVEAGSMLAVFGVYMLSILFRTHTVSAHDGAHESRRPWTAVILGSLAIVLGARLVLFGAYEVADRFDLTGGLVGLVLLAVGTSLPELAAGVSSARKGQADIGLGNVVGSNVFNLLACLGAAAAAGETGLAVPAEVVAREGWIMLAATAVCLPMFFTGHRISRIEGACLLGAYVLYATTAVLRATESASLAAVELIAATVVMPLAMLLLVIDWRKDRRRTA